MISVIVPVYNGERYIEKCVKSVLNQGYSDYELILVDDGSKDNSLKICKELSKKDSRIKVISQENQGPVMARRKGVMNAKGEFVTFLDIDDTFCRKDVLKTIDETITQTNAEIVQFGNFHTYFHGMIKRRNTKTNAIINRQEFEEKVYIDLFGGVPKNITPTVWGKVYPTAKMQEILKCLDIRLNMGDDLYINNLYFEKYPPSIMVNLEYVGIAHGIGIGISVGKIEKNWKDFLTLKELQIEIINRNKLPDNFLYHAFVELVYLLFYSAVQILEEGNNVQELQEFVSESFELELVKKSKAYLKQTEYPKWKEIEDFYDSDKEEYCSTVIRYIEQRTIVEKLKKLIRRILYR